MTFKPLKAATLLLAFCTTGAFAADDQLLLQNANANYVMGGVYTSPYGISINGGPTALLICDDFLTDISLGYSWSATESNVGALANELSPSTQVKFDHGAPASAVNSAAQQMLDYATAAYLANELMTSSDATSNNWGNEIAGEISYAIWGVFDTQLLNTSYQNSLTTGAEGKLTSTELTMAQGFLSTAQAAVAPGGVLDFSKVPNVTIYTSTPQTGAGSSQEFLKVSMAEPSYPAVLALDLLAVVGLIVAFRRRLSGIFN